LIGPEPNLRWRAVATAVAEVVQQLGVAEVVVLGSYWDRVSHLGQALLSGRPGDSAMRERLQALDLPESGYQGPTGFASALMEATTRAGLAAAGLSGRAPHYVQGISHPKLAYGLLRTVERLVGLRFDVDELESAGREQERLLTERVQQEPKLWQYVQRLAAETGQAQGLDDFASDTWHKLSGHADDSTPSSATSRVAADRGELPSGKDAVDAVEEFLRGNALN
jgi:predicted ATP-grasp superfamily ATP-dependent carboligase